MGFNAGAFAGALGQSALSTYERLGEAGFRNLQRQQLAQEMQEKADLDQAWRESQGRVGQQDEYSQAIKTEGFTGNQQAKMLSDQGALKGNTPEDQAFEKASAESATGALRENAVRQGAVPADKAALPELKPTEYTAKQGMQDYMKAASQVSRKGTLEALQLKGAMRENDLQDKFDTSREELDNTLAKIHGISESGGLKGLAEAASKEGLKVKFVEGKNGVGSRIQVLGPKGDVLESITDVGTATDKLSKAAMQQFYDKSISLLGSSDKVIAAMQGERKTVAAERTAQADVEYKGKGGVIDRAYSSGAKGGAKGSGNSAENQEKLVTMKAETLMKGQPGRFKDIDQAKAWVVNTAMKGFDAEKNWADMEKDLVKQRIPAAEIVKEKEAFFSRQGFAPASIIEIARNGTNPDTGKAFTEKEQQDFYRRYPNTDIEFGAPTPAGAGNASAKPAALPVSSQVSQLQNAVNPKALKDIPLPGRYTPGVTQAVEPQTGDDLRRALY